MKKFLTSLMALTFVAALGMSTAVLAAKDDALTKACKDKKAGDTVKVDGKDAKCPAAKK